MFRRLSYNEIPADLKKLVSELRHHGDCVVLEDEDHQPIACLTPLPETNAKDSEYAAWTQLSKSGLARAYGDHEPEYASSLVKEPNPEYEGR